jgi:predicted acyltransferase
MTKVQTNSRLLSLDVLRGITIAGMILVNNPGSWSSIYAPLGHAAWNGLTPTDLVFPFFMFIMGISTFISLRKYNFECSAAALFKILKRVAVIFLIGLALAWLSLSFRTFWSLEGEGLGFFARLGKAVVNFGHIRILGVMQRLALSYGATALIAVLVKHKYIPYIIVGTLLGYFILLLFGNGFEYGETNILSIVDRQVLGIDHIYKDNGIEPEGLLSTIPAIAHVLLGFWVGKMLMQTKGNAVKMQQLFIVGAILTFSGFLLSYGCPINKKIWSPAFVLASCGLASTLLALLVWIIDIKGRKRWSVFFESFGINPLFMYVLAAVLSILLSNIFVPDAGGGSISLKGFLYGVCLQPWAGDYFGSLLFALLFVGFNWLIGNILYKKQIYIKI